MGSFSKRKIYGGINTSCKLILESSYFGSFQIIPFDSTQISNPPPNFIIRMFLAWVRLIHFGIKILLKKPKISLIFCSDGASAIEKGVMICFCKIFGVKTFIFPRAGRLISQTYKSSFFKYLIKFLFNKAELFLAQGENWNRFAKNQLQIPENKIQIINNWTATPKLLEIGLKKDYAQKSDNIKFIFVGWLEKEKGILEILESLQELNKKEYNFFFTFIGDGRVKKYAKEFIAENGLEKRVEFMGWLSNNKLSEYYKNADIFVLPSWAEGMPNALIEALSSGLAVITTDVGMIPNYLSNNENSLILPPRSTKSLTNAMEKLISDNKLKIKISKNGFKVANNYFSTKIGLKILAESIKKKL